MKADELELINQNFEIFGVKLRKLTAKIKDMENRLNIMEAELITQQILTADKR